MMRRRGRSPTQHGKATNAVDGDDASQSSCEPIDEDEQREMVQRLHVEAAKQSKFFQLLFGYGIGGFATLLSLLFPTLCPDECSNQESSCWIHAICSSLLHIHTVYPFIISSKSAEPGTKNNDWMKNINTIYGLLLQVLPLLLWITGLAFNHDEDHFHLGLIIGNAVTYGGSWVVYYDMMSTNKALNDLDNAQYRHKAL
jgi:hypothetical protein